MAGNFGDSGQSSEPKPHKEVARIGSCRRSVTNSRRQISTLKASPHPRCPARLHGDRVDRSSFALSISFPSRKQSRASPDAPSHGTSPPDGGDSATLEE